MINLVDNKRLQEEVKNSPSRKNKRLQEEAKNSPSRKNKRKIESVKKIEIITKKIKQNLNFGEAKTQSSKDKSTDKMFKLNNPQYKDKPFLLSPAMYDKKMKELISTG